MNAERWAVQYLQRWPCSQSWFCDAVDRMLERRRRQSKFVPIVDKDKLVEQMQRAGLLDDEAYSGALFRSLKNGGRSRRAIAEKLRHKGVPREMSEKLLATLERGDELEAAREIVRRKKLGDDPERLQKDLAKLARRGFSFEVARAALAS